MPIWIKLGRNVPILEKYNLLRLNQKEKTRTDQVISTEINMVRTSLVSGVKTRTPNAGSQGSSLIQELDPTCCNQDPIETNE